MIAVILFVCNVPVQTSSEYSRTRYLKNDKLQQIYMDN